MNLNFNIYYTWQCNFRCAHCLHSCDMSGKHMSKEVFKRAYDFLKWAVNNPSLDVRVVGITGGEPTLHPDFWVDMMPMIREIKTDRKDIPFELHTNGSIPIPKEQLEEKHSKIFNTIFIGRDIFHDKFKKTNELALDDYCFIGKTVNLTKNAYYVGNFNKIFSFIRRKGRADEIIPKIKTPNKLICSSHENLGYRSLGVDFTPDYIIFCGEHPTKTTIPDGKIALSYDSNPTNEEIVQKAFTYNQLYSGRRCLNPCINDLVTEDDFV
jgi:hypothetical protein